MNLSPRLSTALAVALVSLTAACGGAAPRTAEGQAPLVTVLASPAGAGSERLRAGDPAGARAAYEGVLAKDPEALGALNDLAVSYLVEGHAEAARRLLDDVVAQGSPREQQAALLNLGELYALDGYLDAAQAYLESARGVDRDRPEPWYALALLADARGDAPAVRTAISEALRLDESGAARASLAYVFPEERVHLEALVAERTGEGALAAARWRELAGGRLEGLSTVAERHLAGE